MTPEELDTITRLHTRLSEQAPRLRREDAYYEGAQRLAAIGLAVPPEMQDLFVVVNWPRVLVHSLANRQIVEGFRLAGQWRGDQRLWDWWTANNLGVESQMAHIEVLVHGRAYLCGGYREDEPDVPAITVEAATTMIAETDPRTRKVTAALRVYETPEGSGRLACVLYLPEATIYAEHTGGAWRETDRHEHRLGVVPVVVMRNRTRVHQQLGRSEMNDVMSLTDACCRTLMLLQGAQELMATPQRYILGADQQLFEDAAGNPIPTWQAYLAHILAIPDAGGTDVKIGQFSAADLRNFTEVINTYSHLVSSMTGLPPHYLGITSANPASAAAITGSEVRLVNDIEWKNTGVGGAWVEAMRLGALITGADAGELRRAEAIMRNPATPTLAERADAVTKLFSTHLYDAETALEEMGHSPERIRVVMERRRDDPMLQLLAMEGGDDGVDDRGVQPSPGGDQPSRDRRGAAAA